MTSELLVTDDILTRHVC